MNIGVFGGAFDPFHEGHRKIIECAQRELRLETVVVLPSFAPPHKESKLSSYEIRKEMARAGTAGLEHFVVIDNTERQRNAVNPTSVVLPVLKQKYPCEGFYYIMGGDSAVNFPSWIEPQKIADTARLAVVSRAGSGSIEKAADCLRRTYKADVSVLSYEGDWVSSSCIKAAVELGLRPKGVSDAVFGVIINNRLYSEFRDIVGNLKSDIPEKTFLHSVRTVLYAERFTGLLKLKFEDVFLSCLLHDCAKHLPERCPNVPDAVVHQFTGAERAKQRFGITDDALLDAIRYHTSGKRNMTTLGKLVYCADMLESERSFDGAEELRLTLEEDFDKGFAACIHATSSHLEKKNAPIYPLTKECADYYNNKEPR